MYLRGFIAMSLFWGHMLTQYNTHTFLYSTHGNSSKCTFIFPSCLNERENCCSSHVTLPDENMLLSCLNFPSW